MRRLPSSWIFLVFFLQPPQKLLPKHWGGSGSLFLYGVHQTGAESELMLDCVVRKHSYLSPGGTPPNFAQAHPAQRSESHARRRRTRWRVRRNAAPQYCFGEGVFVGQKVLPPNLLSRAVPFYQPRPCCTLQAAGLPSRQKTASPQFALRPQRHSTHGQVSCQGVAESTLHSGGQGWLT